MSYTVRKESGYAIGVLDGEVDLSTAPDTRRMLLEQLEAGSHLLVDLSSVRYIDSSGIACLVESYQLAKKKGLKFGLIGVSGAAMNVLQLARLDQVFPIHQSVAERIQADS